MSNLTLSIDKELLKKARKIAIEKDTTVNQMVREYLESIIEKEAYKEEDVIKQLKEHYSKTSIEIGTINWQRDELYER